MKAFDVLDRNQKIHRHTILEASAGTGKTFAIENIVLRLLIESSNDKLPEVLEKILVVTFTRAAARELKERIRKNLEKALDAFKMALKSNLLSMNGSDEEKLLAEFPDYILAIIEQGKDSISDAKRLIEKALLSFDGAQIFTIHSFCWRMLKSYAIEGKVGLKASFQEDEGLSKTKLLQAVRDFLRTELSQNVYSSEQLRIVLSKHGRKVDALEQNLLRAVDRDLNIIAPPNFSEYFRQFKIAMAEIKGHYSFDSNKIIEDFLIQSKAYNGLRDQKKQIYRHVLDKVKRFATLFDQSSWEEADFDMLIADGLIFLEAFDSDNLAAKASQVDSKSLHYPDFLMHVRDFLGPLVTPARDGEEIFSLLADNCQKYIRHFRQEEEMFTHQDLLERMHQAIENESFVEKVRSSYDVAIIDEFQDTDPVQWKIFSELFGKTSLWKGYLYLVGDPKQSIYAFRQADIYTYLEAASQLGKESIATLSKNFRSQPQLIEALNKLFTAAHDLFPLPKCSKSLSFHPVIAGKTMVRKFADSEQCLHFWVVENSDKKRRSMEYSEAYFFPQIAKELFRLFNEDKVEYSQCSVLVADRYQADRLMRYLQSQNIPVKTQRSKDLAKSPALAAMREIIQGLFFYQKRGMLKLALGGKVIGMTHDQLLALNDMMMEKILKQSHHLNQLLLNDGFSHFIDNFMQSSWHPDGKTIMERLLIREGGSDFVREWQDLIDLLSNEQETRNLTIEGILAFFDEMEMLALNEAEKIKTYFDLDQDGISLMTMHASKGLEFDVVFAIGLLKRPQEVENLIVNKQGSERYEHKSELYRRQCEEVDAEKMRQLYVALTRAKYRLYIPVVIEGAGDISYGTASPMELFLARLNQPESNYEGLYQRIKNQDIFPLAGFVEKNSELMALTVLKEPLSFFNDKPIESAIEIIPPQLVRIPGSPLSMQSFTSLSMMKEAIVHEHSTEASAPHDFFAERKTSHTLPSGNETGILLHRILEVMPFEDLVGPSSLLRAKIYPFLQGTPFESWQDVIAEMILKVIKAPLKTNEGWFCLADIDPKKIYREAEFIYPCLEGCIDKAPHVRTGYLKGVIDLLFEHQGKYFLVDWKSNWLGPDISCYKPECLERAMGANFYDLQADIYMDALRRYLNVFNMPFAEVFGGIYYIFLRGFGADTGVFRVNVPNVNFSREVYNMKGSKKSL